MSSTEKSECVQVDLEDPSVKKRQRFWHKITLEPILGSCMLAITIASTAFHNAFLQRACMVDLGISEDVCLHGKGQERIDAEQASQKLLAQIGILRSVVSHVIQAAIMMFFGPWSDVSRRRKPLVLMPILGMIVAYLNMIVMLLIPKMTVTWMIYLEMLPIMVCGGHALLFVSAFNHLGDICFKTGRDATSLMGVNSAAIQACSVVGSVAGPFIYRSAGLIAVFSTSLVFQTFAFIYGWQMMKDVDEPVKNVTLLDFKLPWISLKSLFIKREGSKRKVLIIIVIVSLIHSFLMSAEVVNMYMYLRIKFAWTEVEYGFYNSYKSILSCISIIFIITILTKRLKISDEMLGVIGSFSHGIMVLMLYNAATTVHVFLAPILGVLQPASNLVHKPILNHQIEADEQGKVNSVIVVLDILVHLFAGPASIALYAATVTTNPGFFLVPCIVISFLQVFCFLGIINKKTTFTITLCSSIYMYSFVRYQ